jgi:hypothetical protein
MKKIIHFILVLLFLTHFISCMGTEITNDNAPPNPGEETPGGDNSGDPQSEDNPDEICDELYTELENTQNSEDIKILLQMIEAHCPEE